MNSHKTPGSLFLFYLMALYVFIQFLWWAYLLLGLNKKVYSQSMVIGEGLVFLAFMIAGIIRIRSNFKREAAIARQQKNFLLSVTHELKSPLASIKLMFETIQKRELEKVKLQELASNGVKDAERLNNLVENILLTAEFDNKTHTLSKEPSNLSIYIKSVLEKLIPVIGNRHKITMQIDENIFMPIDKLNFQSIISNLLENAVKYSPENSSILIQLTKRNNTIAFSVIDEGPGIEDEEKTKIFYKFYRIGNEETRTTKGTGLGLYIVKQLVERHNGTISVKNNQPKGSIFEVVFEKEGD